MSAVPLLRTRRLTLQQFTEADAPAFFEIMSDERTNTFLPWYPVKTPDQAAKMLTDLQKSGWFYGIFLEGRAAGYVSLSGTAPYDLGYGLLPAYWGRGFAAEAAGAVLARGKALMPYATATHDRNNPASGAVMKKLGMRYCYSYEELWQPKNIPVVFRLYQINFDGSDSVYPGYAERYPHFVERDV
ncbi:GNAT family N-acetyltransferase [Gehongia tenuis]|uniref:GNAT family N-acetyltransferase n=1 Tax=Gehongia tenuis TaxID=2763655 RepID=A0A926D3Y5_9FIRM|nr:GNAT family N-acetyltransferase [Gehongia tenuis]MBC8530459.1 GNAT family N-acetyltransferase [Gehongia tenuis]